MNIDKNLTSLNLICKIKGHIKESYEISRFNYYAYIVICTRCNIVLRRKVVDAE